MPTIDEDSMEDNSEAIKMMYGEDVETVGK